MNKNKSFMRGGLRRKLTFLCTMMVVVTAAVFVVFSLLRIIYSWRLTDEASRMQNETIKKQSQDALTSMSNEAMLDTISLSAKEADSEFWTLRHDFSVFARQVQDVFDHSDQYEERPVYGPDPENKGKYVLQIVFADEAASRDSDTLEMAGKLANLAPMMAEIIQGNDDYAKDCCIAMPNGTTLFMDMYSDRKTDDKGNASPYDPRVRPWYVHAVEKGEFCFNPPVKDYYDNTDNVEYACPIYADGELVAVVKGSTGIDTLREFISDVGLGEGSFSIMVSDDGRLIYSLISLT